MVSLFFDAKIVQITGTVPYRYEEDRRYRFALWGFSTWNDGVGQTIGGLVKFRGSRWDPLLLYFGVNRGVVVGLS